MLLPLGFFPSFENKKLFPVNAKAFTSAPPIIIAAALAIFYQNVFSKKKKKKKETEIFFLFHSFIS